MKCLSLPASYCLAVRCHSCAASGCAKANASGLRRPFAADNLALIKSPAVERGFSVLGGALRGMKGSRYTCV